MTESLRSLCKRSLLLVSMARGARSAIEHYRREKLVREWRRARASAAQAYFQSHTTRKLQIGAQENIMPGWLNTDLEPVDGRVVFLDARQPFPFEDSIFDYVFSEHCIEHMTYADGLLALRECYRVLKPGGRIRVATPNLNTIVSLCDRRASEMQQRYMKWYIDTFTPEFPSYAPSFVVNNCFRLWGHQFLYDPETLGAALESAGFRDLCWFAPGESGDENLRGIEGHGRRVGEDMNRLETMVVEGMRPRAALSSTAYDQKEQAIGCVMSREANVEKGNSAKKGEVVRL